MESGVTSQGVRNAYEQWAPEYDSVANATRDLAISVLQEEIPHLPLKDFHALEFGCGTGLATEILAKHSASVSAFDLSASMLEIAKRRNQADHVKFIEHDLTQPWPISMMAPQSGSFDFVVGSLVLEHIENLSFVYGQIGKALRADGLLLLSEFHPFRQLTGKQAEFRNPTQDQVVSIDSFRHSLSDYINPAIEAGFCLCRVREDRHETDLPEKPRLLTLTFKKL